MDRYDALLINVGDQSYALPLLKIQEIRGWSPVSPLPNTDPSCLGIINLRGNVLPVFDARRILGKPTPEPTAQNVIVVATVHGKPVGLLVDSVSDIVSVDGSTVTRPDETDNWSSRLVDGIANVDDRLVPLLSLDSIAGDSMPALPDSTGDLPELTGDGA
ncbi:chemotaxis protein CheW [Ferrovibrio sp.]|uniref:chemotaxis protein CheW n=1 Tax=Ferrovibrio sp. TaxID=1917215 RepID=UPI0031204C33